ncbi:MAG: DUF2779 domain-containing protein [Chloroflexi bacterium]|nr:MAG: DUF2779 domain-containing protein [Chloroflexota bacterium]
MLTKSSYLTYLQCPKAFWLAQHTPQIGIPLSPAAQRRTQTGHEVEEYARQNFPNGYLIPRQTPRQHMADTTQKAIKAGHKVLFQATFIHNNLLVITDIVIKTSNGWKLIEVKATTKPKKEHSPDLAIQKYAMEANGLKVTETAVMHLNPDYRHPNQGDLFLITDITDQVNTRFPQITSDLNQMTTLHKMPSPPQVSVGRQCGKTSDDCPFRDHCWENITGLTIYHIPRLQGKKQKDLEDNNILHLDDLPQTFSASPTQKPFLQSYQTKKPVIDRSAIRTALQKLEYPLYFLDFESIDHAIPCYDGCKPYENVPFQYSCHILHQNGHLEHREYLHTSSDDPRPALVNALLKDIGPRGHIVVYNKTFEKGILKGLAETFPNQKTQLENMLSRLWDQLDIFKHYYCDYRFKGSNSLKNVLPVVTNKTFSYDNLNDVRNGEEAQIAWLEMLATTDVAEKARLTQELRAYCHLDTLAMVEIHKFLVSL